MSFSQQSYTGQGIVQPYMVDRSGENLARGISAFGEGIARGIEGRAKIKSQAASLRTKLAPFAEDLAKTYGVEPGNWKAFLDDKGLSDLQGISDGFIVSMAKQLHDREVAKNDLAIKTQDQEAKAIQGILKAEMPQDVPIEKQDFTGEIDKARVEEERLSGMMQFAPKPEGSMGTDASLRYIENQPMGNVSGPAYLQQRPLQYGPEDTRQGVGTVLRPTMGPSAPVNIPDEDARLQIAPRSDLEQERLEQRAIRGSQNEESNVQPGYAQSMAAKAAQAREALGQLDEEIAQPLEDIRQELSDLEFKQLREDSKADSRPETAQEYTKRRTDSLRKLIDENPLAAETIYTALMGKSNKDIKLDAEARQAVGFADRMESAEKELEEISKKYDRSGAMQGILSIIPNQMKSQERRQYEAVMLDWITANLRRESGAAIGQEEYKNDMKKYFPSAGDSKETMELKARRRKEAVRAITKPIDDSYNKRKGMTLPSPSTSSPAGEPSRVKEYGSDGNLISR